MAPLVQQWAHPGVEALSSAAGLRRRESPADSFGGREIIGCGEAWRERSAV